MELSQKYHKTPAQILLRYNIQNGVVVIPKSIHKDRIQENIDLFDFKLTKQEMNDLKALDHQQVLIGNPENPAFVEMTMTW